MSQSPSPFEELFHQALALQSDEREAFLRRECDGNPARLRELRRLLANVDRMPSDFLQGQAAATAPTGVSPTSQPDQIREYKIVRTLGQGGMGIVYEAHQEHPRRSVALKVIRSPLASRELIRRFRNEAEILGQLHHPGIAHIYEAGFADDADVYPFYAMELVRGLPLTRYCREHQLSLRGQLELVARVCDAVHHAHQKGIVHRDLKPANVLVTETERDSSNGPATGATEPALLAQPKVLDFGIAHNSETAGQASFQTATGQLLGTLSYMAPEQMTGKPTAIDARCDVYALGVILYELLSGQVPLEVSDRPLPEAVSIVCNEDPARLTDLVPQLDRDVETIVAKALEKDRGRRYSSAADLAFDLRRFLRDEPILARPASTWYQVTKFTQRNRNLVAAASITLIALTVGLILAISGNLEASDQRDRALAAGTAMRQALTQKDAALTEKDAALAAKNAALLEKDAALSQAQGDALLARAGAELQSDPSHALELALQGVEKAPGPVADHVLLRSLVELREERVLCRDAVGFECGSLDGDGSHAVAGNAQGWVRLWEVESGRLLWEVHAHPTFIAAISFCHDDQRVVSLGWDGFARVWDVATGQLVSQTEIEPEWGRGNTIVDTDLEDMDIRGDRLLFCARRPVAWIVSLEQNRIVTKLEGHQAGVISVRLDDRGRALTLGSDGTARVWDAQTGHPIAVLTGHRAQLRDGDFHPDGEHIVTVGHDGSACLHHIASGRVTVRMSAHRRVAYNVRFLPHGRQFVTTGADCEIRVWDTQTGRLQMSLRGHADSVTDMAISLDGRRVFSASRDGTARLWEPKVAGQLELFAIEFGPIVHAMPDAWDERIVVATGGVARNPGVWLRDGREDSPEWSRLGEFSPLQCARISPDGQLAIGTGYNGVARLWDIDLGELRFALDGGTYRNARALVYHASFDPDGERVVLASQDGAATIWDTATGEQLHRLAGPGPFFWCAEFSPLGDLVVTGGVERALRLWDADSGELTTSYEQPHGVVRVAFHPDGDRIAVSYAEYTWTTPASRIPPRYLHMSDGSEVFPLPEGAGGLASFSSDGTLLATAAVDGTIVVVDADTAEELFRLPAGLVNAVSSLYFWKDDTELLVASYEGAVIRIPLSPSGYAKTCLPHGPVDPAAN